jgi:hypothetical protein
MMGRGQERVTQDDQSILSFDGKEQIRRMNIFIP